LTYSVLEPYFYYVMRNLYLLKGFDEFGFSHRHLQRSLDWMGRACSLTPHVTEPHTIGLLPSGYTKPLTYSHSVDTEEDLTARVVEAAATIRREPGIF
jgi:hypothetical protein